MRSLASMSMSLSLSHSFLQKLYYLRLPKTCRCGRATHLFFRASERNVRDAHRVKLGDATFIVFVVDAQRLPTSSDRAHQSSAVCELFEKFCRFFRRSGADVDDVVWRVRGVPFATVGDFSDDERFRALQVLAFTVLFGIFDGEIHEIFDVFHANDDWVFRI